MAKEKYIRAYTSEDLSDIFTVDKYKVEYANPRYFKQPKHTVDFVYSNRQYIIDAYEAIGIPSIYADEKAEDVKPEVPDPVDQDSSEPDDENASEDITTADETTEEDVSEDSEDSVEDTTADEGVDLGSMSAADIKEYARKTTGKTPKTKNEALEILGYGE